MRVSIKHKNDKTQMRLKQDWNFQSTSARAMINDQNWPKWLKNQNDPKRPEMTRNDQKLS